jgi:uncharacterized protein YlxW (UPF0749 family)
VLQTARQHRLLDVSGFFIALFVMAGLLGLLVLMIPFFAIWTYHKRKMEELRLRGEQQIAAQTQAALDSLRAEMAALRDTTTEYDMSFDTALRRIESRVERVEQRVGQVEQAAEGVSTYRG